MFRLITRSAPVAVLAILLAACASHGSPALDVPVPILQSNVLTADVIGGAGAVPLEQLIADRIPGIELSHSADGRPMLRIRGTTSWWGNREPLYVVDGFPLLNNIGGAPYFNNADIQRLEVLKDAANTSMYGSRGASGVILIETKRR